MSVARTFTLSFLAVAMSSGAPAYARVTSPPAKLHLSVTICDTEERVAKPLLAAAERIAGDVYRDIGIAIDWTEGDCRGNEEHLALDVISHAAAEMDLADVAVGYAEPGTSVATVLYDRVKAFARRYGVRRHVLLGYVMAHELGHLLLPPNSHSDAGVMRAVLDLQLAAAKRLRFTPEQSVLILRKVEGAQPPMAVATH